MKTYAEKESATQESGRKSEEDTGARHLGEPDSLNTGWQRLADRIGRDREWDFGLGDAVPQWITLLPGWQESGLLLAVRAGTATHYFPERRTDADVVRVVLRENHYWALVNGGEVKVTDDGNCFFYAVWTVPKEPEHAEAARKIFRGRV